jgi:hypothetical protein
VDVDLNVMTVSLNDKWKQTFINEVLEFTKSGKQQNSKGVPVHCWLCQLVSCCFSPSSKECNVLKHAAGYSKGFTVENELLISTIGNNTLEL